MQTIPATRFSVRSLLALLCAFAFPWGGCTKEKPNCGHGVPSANFRFHLVDDRTGLEWFTPPRPFSLDTLKKLNGQTFTAIESGQLTRSLVWGGFSLGNDYPLPKSGGDKSYAFFIRLNSTDTDTIEAHVIYGQLAEDACPLGFRYFQSVEFHYNGKPYGPYNNGSFYNGSGSGSPVTFRKRP